MINSLVNRLLLVALFVCMCGSIAKAQCPNPPPPPTSIPWNSYGTQAIVVGPGCIFYVDVCYRSVGGITQTVFTRVEEDPSNTCNIAWNDLLEQLAPAYFEAGTSCEGIYPSCNGPDPMQQHVIQMATCWKVISVPHPDRPNTEACTACWGESGYCEILFKLCCENDALQVIELARNTVVTNQCTLEFTSPFVYDQCYVMINCE